MADTFAAAYRGRINYPFSAVCGQEKLKLALLLNVINPQIGGALIRGERGSGKTTAVRGIVDILPDIEVVAGCRFSCDPADISKMCSLCRAEHERGIELPVVRRRMRMVELPVGSTEDRVVGTLNMERAITDGVKALEMGILAEANRGILYVDNINLLDDHIMDVLLDSAAMGVNVVEREGVSISHPAGFILIGTMNPDEGELRPQLHDRLALHVEVRGLESLKGRLAIMKRAAEFERDPLYFKRLYQAAERDIAHRVLQAQKILSDVTADEYFLRLVACMCILLDVDGHRPDIIIARAAITKAAYEGRKEVSEDDVIFASELALGYRMRRAPFEDAALGAAGFQQVFEHAKKLEAEERTAGKKQTAKKPGRGRVGGSRKSTGSGA